VRQSDANEAVCTYLDWDSQFFQRRIARLNRRRLDERSAAEVLGWCGENKIDCLYFLADADDAKTVRLAQQNNFIQTDVRVTFERLLINDDRLLPESADGIVRLGDERDLVALRKIASTCHRDSRFYFDEEFERSKCDLLYATWIESSFKDFAQAVLVVEVAAQPVGYITCHLSGRESRIGLVGIADTQKGKGLGKKLVKRFLAWSSEQRAHRAIVVTQGRNIGAQRLYQRCGFLTSSFQLWYHRWFVERQGERKGRNR
jgi:dTDP-4-amino-4,6-dideoxy-D-galactose acyltransferase